MAECRDVVGRQGTDRGTRGRDGVLAHGRYDDSVLEGQGADGEGLEEGRDFGGGGVGGAWGDFVLGDEVGDAGDGRV